MTEHDSFWTLVESSTDGTNSLHTYKREYSYGVLILVTFSVAGNLVSSDMTFVPDYVTAIKEQTC